MRDANAREHYEEVGKSKLRKPKEVALGPQYSGSRISRDAAEESDEEDDPFSRGFDEDDSEDEVNGMDGASEEDEEMEDGTDATDLSDDEEGEEDGGVPVQENAEDRAELRKIMASEQKAVAASISAANKADAEKGRAVKKQRVAFDSLLNARVKLQKGLVATNTLVAPSTISLRDEASEAQDAISAAETAAFNLWSSLTTFREELISARTGDKRKRTAYSTNTPTEKLWDYTQQQEERAITHRNAVLQKWSLKARGPTATPQGSRLNNTATQATIVDVLQEHLSQPDRLLKRAQTPRSCAPVQLAAKVPSDPQIYDDADFYGLLLKELLEAKAANNDYTAAANLDLGSLGSMRREAKTKRNVDVKASKGRKLKYSVHEKLQNFMAPEAMPHGWGERQTDELFGSLFGQRLGLAELEEDDGDEMMDGAPEDEEEAGLMMFRR